MGAFPLSMINPSTIGQSNIAATSVVETAPQYVAGNTYNSGDTVQLGDYVYECTVTAPATTTVNPATAVANQTGEWVDIDVINPLRAFNGSVSNYASASGNLTYTINGLGSIDSIAFFELQASEVRVDITVAGVSVYSSSLNLISKLNISNWYQYFFNRHPPAIRSAVFNGIPQTAAGGDIHITIVGSNTRVGEIAIGTGYAFGEVLLDDGTVRGRDTYGAIITDDFGIARTIDRKEYDYMKYKIALDPSECAEFLRFMGERASKFTVFHVDNSAPNYELYTIFGYVTGPVEIPLGHRNNVTCTIETIGVT